MLHDFATRLIHWQRRCGRHDLPWQIDAATPDPYPIWISEIMLQQTRVETVIPYYTRFLARFPDIASLAAADEEEVLACWSGLGYYSRARNLHAAARRVMASHGGKFPSGPEEILALPGVGRSTAAAIAAFAFNQRQAILDGNVKRVLARIFGVDGWTGLRHVEERLWRLAEALLPSQDIRLYTQGLMDLGATLCTRGRPRCEACPFADDCVAHREGRQGELPGPRPKKALPERETAMLVLIHAGEILLEKRPATGIWGGLWSLPECARDDDVGRVARRQGYLVETVEALPGLVHSFTHFRLTISPWLLHVRKGMRAEEPGRIWLPRADVGGAALPTPVRRILAGLTGPA
ncbi:MAG: A/G-specific adenine glycosylase [Thiobacillus sp.]|nr:A/G-specific adenine glycosylase [Thiobacillus sp.]